MHTRGQWKTASGISALLVQAMKGPKAIADFDAPEASTINEVKSTKNPGLCFRCSGPHFQNRCTKHRNQPKTNFSTHHLHNKIAKELIIHKNSVTIETTIVCFLQEPLSFEASQQKSSSDISFSINTIKCFLGTIGKNIV